MKPTEIAYANNSKFPKAYVAHTMFKRIGICARRAKTIQAKLILFMLRVDFFNDSMYAGKI